MSAVSQCDPIEKNPSSMLTQGTGIQLECSVCDLHCSYCQNWVTSQALRDPAAAVGPMRVTPAELVLDALRQRRQGRRQQYNEPLITSEWHDCL